VDYGNYLNGAMGTPVTGNFSDRITDSHDDDADNRDDLLTRWARFVFNRGKL